MVNIWNIQVTLSISNCRFIFIFYVHLVQMLHMSKNGQLQVSHASVGCTKHTKLHFYNTIRLLFDVNFFLWKCFFNLLYSKGRIMGVSSCSAPEKLKKVRSRSSPTLTNRHPLFYLFRFNPQTYVYLTTNTAGVCNRHQKLLDRPLPLHWSWHHPSNNLKTSHMVNLNTNVACYALLYEN